VPPTSLSRIYNERFFQIGTDAPLNAIVINELIEFGAISTLPNLEPEFVLL
jgi:hypothetical protein